MVRLHLRFDVLIFLLKSIRVAHLLVFATTKPEFLLYNVVVFLVNHIIVLFVVFVKEEDLVLLHIEREIEPLRLLGLLELHLSYFRPS